jgi:folate-dependent phosphoribosylglycinamide formyltransferase PurN
VTLRLGWFATARGAASRKLLEATQEAIKSGCLKARIAVVFCNRAAGEDANTDAFQEQVRGYGIPLVCLSSRDFRRARGQRPVRKGEALPDWRHEYDRQVMRLLEPHRFDLGVLAGYMLIFSEEAAKRWDLLNLHPAAPGGPKGMWQDVIWELIRARAERAGVMMHLATPELDEGPPVTYCTYPIRGPKFDPLWAQLGRRSVEQIQAEEGESNALFAEIRRHGAAREAPLVVETLRAFADGRVRVENKRVVDATGRPVGPQDLTPAIERAVAASLV